jgi:hypothetical protein
MNSLVKQSVLLGLLATAAIPTQAAPSVALGDDATLFLKLSGSVEHQSNILRQEFNEESDTIFVFTPGVELQLGTENSAYAEVNLGVQARVHDDNDELDGEYLRLNALGYYDTGVALFKGYVTGNQYGSNGVAPELVDGGLVEVPAVAERSDYAAGGSVVYGLTDQVSVSGGLDLFRRSFDTASKLSGTESFAIPVKVFYAFDPALSAFAGYRFRDSTPYDVTPSDVGRLSDTEDHYFFVGLEGELFNPLWTASIDAGYQTRDYSGGVLNNTESDTFSYTARINYAAATNINLYGTLSSDFGQGVTGSAIAYIRDQLTVGGDYLISEMWSANFAFTLAKTEYEDQDGEPGRVDNLTSLNLGVAYNPNEYVTIRGSYRINYLNKDFVPTQHEYTNNIFSVTASLRY